jgi:hypothetical protein
MSSLLRATAIAIVLLAGGAITAGAQQTSVLQDPTHDTRTEAVKGLTPTASQCGISSDATYGVTPANPIKVGGGPLYLASREVKYLSALRGPAGQGTHFSRGGSLPFPAPAGPDSVILDVYTIEYDGLDHPTRLYLDGYHWAQPVAPSGWLCGADMNLAPPGPDPMTTQVQLQTLAVLLGNRRATPISMDPDGSALHGVIFDHIRLIGAAAWGAAAAGQALNPQALPREVASPHMIAIAYPMACDGKSIAPESVTLTDGSGNSPPVAGQAKGDRVADLVPGFTPPPGAIAVSFSVPSLIPGARTVIRYAEGCRGADPQVVLPVTMAPARVTQSVPGKAPQGVTVPPAGALVRVQVFLMSDGVPLLPAYVSGPYELADAAMAAATQWRVEPPTVNGAPLLQTSVLGVMVH